MISYLRHTNTLIIAALMVAISLIALAYSADVYRADADQSVAELQQKITDSKRALEAIEKEIREFEAQLNQVGAERRTLQGAINELDLARRKLQSEIQATEQRISATDLEIQEIDREIHIKELQIRRSMDAIGQSFRTIDQIENRTLVEILLGNESLAEVWDSLAMQTTLQLSLRDHVRVLSELKKAYESGKAQSLSKRDQLDGLKRELSGERQAVDSVRNEKDTLLDRTKNEEAEYQRILSEKRAARQKFEREMNEYEAQLKFILDPTTIPPAGSGVLRWPLESSLMNNCTQRTATFGNQHCITQYFGNTAFARSGAYNGSGHNGVDFGIPTGTKILSVLNGVVVETGNTDAVPGCLSYGKWILIRHPNGLSSLYAHLSSINVVAGQTVGTGELIGFSGNTGYSTGPHLHLTVFASKGVQVVRLGDVRAITSCGPARIPVAGFEAYLNPMDYL